MQILDSLWYPLNLYLINKVEDIVDILPILRKLLNQTVL